MPSSPSATYLPLASPSRDSPNAHPYAIKTSSSAVLTRSNSAGNRDSSTHHYTPLSPTKNKLVVKQGRYVPSHRHTRSMSTFNEGALAKPPPVPMPTSPSVLDGVVSDGEGIPPTPPMTWRIKRSDTLPSVFPNKSDSEISAQDIPKNPKLWTPSQLAVYLSSSLRLKGGVKLPVPVARDITAFVIKEHLGGRAFLRMKKEDYDKLGINQLWKDTLVDASRTLRQNLVQGRIMGFGSSSPLSPRSTEEMDEDEDDVFVDPPGYSRLERPTPLQWEEDKRRMSRTTFRVGRVRGMVETYERSVSGSSASGSDCDEEDKMPETNGTTDAVQSVREPEGVDAGFASGELTSASEDEALAPPPPVPTMDESPSIEDLLRDQEPHGLDSETHHNVWGAKAWEEDIDNLHVTAKRLSLGTVHRVSEWQNTMPHPNVEGARTGLSEIFEQPVTEAPLVLKTTQDVGVGASAEDRMSSNIHETLEAFRQRLEIVERRLDELERNNTELPRVANDNVSVRHPEPESESRIVVLGRRLPRLFDLLFPADQKRKAKNYSDTDPTLAGLPRYMFLVSLGVVAVITRIVLRRMIGGNKRD